ncbi:MAG: hypothetical protein HZA04_07060 [Nitrospinae bacterium]|nr:hypothetical protein [Nitrospinota bacterium]
MRFVFTIIIVALMAIPAYAADVAHENKVDYLGVTTGEAMEKVIALQPALKEQVSASFGEIQKRAATDFSLFLRHPKEGRYFDRFLNVMPVKIFSAPLACGTMSEAISLLVPANAGDHAVLYSYSFVSCANDPLVTPVRMVDKYVEKYGLYDEKDFDRNQHVYNKVLSRWQVRVKPVALADKGAALVITVIDETVFGEAYRLARFKLRQSEENSKEKF